MRKRSIAVIIPAVLAMAAFTGCTESPTVDPGEERPIPDSPAGHMSYGAGYALGASVRDQLGEDFDPEGFQAGIADLLAGREMRVTDEQFEQARDAILARRGAAHEAEAAANLEASRAFLAENAAREEVVVTESGLQYEILARGEGNRPGPESEVITHYTGRLGDGTVFDSSEARGEPARFGLDRVIPGWQEALQLMREGDRFRIWIPPELAYGEQGVGEDIPANAALVFDIELIEVDP